MTRVRKYVFRAESLLEVVSLKELMTPRFKIGQTPRLPNDYFVAVETVLDMEDVQKLMKKLPDSQVMVQTIVRKSRYNGELRPLKRRRK